MAESRQKVGSLELYADEQKYAVIADPGRRDWRDHRYILSAIGRFSDDCEIAYKLLRQRGQGL